MQAQGSQQVSPRAPRPVPGSAGSVRAFAGVAQLVEHLFCKQVVSGSIPLASSGASVASAKAPQVTRILKISEGCPSGQREQAVNLPAHAYVGSNPTPSTKTNPCGLALGSGLFVLGSSAPPRWSESSGAPPQVLGPRPQNGRRGLVTTQTETSRRGSVAAQAETRRRGMLCARPRFGVAGITSFPALRASARSLSVFAGVTQLVESQFSKLKVDGSSPFSRSSDQNLSRRFSLSSAGRHLTTGTTLKQARPASLVAGEASASTGAERTPVREHRSGAEAQPARKVRQSSSRSLKQARSASLVASEAEARTGAERTLVREHRTGAEAQLPAKIAERPNSLVNVTAHLAQMVEHVLGKDEVTSSILVVGSNRVQPQ